MLFVWTLVIEEEVSKKIIKMRESGITERQMTEMDMAGWAQNFYGQQVVWAQYGPPFGQVITQVLAHNGAPMGINKNISLL